ncbi:UNVERIFIED_CONTAM: hypothetical protein GTU68_012329, partial [Idotea baltica]|nr:hypothetical protein [Idotea baltica]
MEFLKIAGIQTSLEWENHEANRQNFEGRILAADSEIDILVLPEMFTTGFSMKPERLAEDMQGETIHWMKKLADKTNTVLAGSAIIQDSGRFFNRMLWVEPCGHIEWYDKRHLFTLAGEDDEYTAGGEPKIVDYKGWRINLNICYDLRFPVWSRNANEYDVVIYVANWPSTRIVAWSTLLRARAIENQCYVVGVNRIGLDANAKNYSGQSTIIDMEGNYLSEA